MLCVCVCVVERRLSEQTCKPRPTARRCASGAHNVAGKHPVLLTRCARLRVGSLCFLWYRHWGFAGSRFPELSPGGKLTKLRFRQLAPGHQNAPRPPYHTQLTRAPHASHRGTSTRTYTACLFLVGLEVASVESVQGFAYKGVYGVR